MAMVVQQRESNSNGGIIKNVDSGKHVRYTSEQVDALERVYAECPKPSSLRRLQLIRECPTLANIEPKQIKVWFQNRRCRDKQRNESSRLQSVNKNLMAMNKLLTEENERLQKQVSQLVCENGYMRQHVSQLHQPSMPTIDASSKSLVAANTRSSLEDANSILSIAKETLTDFLSKATGIAGDWVQMHGMKPGPDSADVFAVSQSRNGVAARASGLVSLEPAKIAEILKDRPSWFRDCRRFKVVSTFQEGNKGTIELLYTQTYAHTTLTAARDFWTLRYTTAFDGSLVVCERSLSAMDSVSNATTSASPKFVRSEMLPSGYLIRPCDGGGSIIHIVDHLNLEPWNVPEVSRPLYSSSKVLAQRVTISALRYARQIAQEKSSDVAYGLCRQPAVLRNFSQRLSRGFNIAVNGFNDDGWSLLSCDGAKDVTLAVNAAKNLTSGANALPWLDCILCAKASVLVPHVSPAMLIRSLREHRSEWADFNIDAYTDSSLNPSILTHLGSSFTGRQMITPLGHAIEHEEVLEIVRLEGHEDAFGSRDINLLQMCSGLDENTVGACSELIFAPIDELYQDDDAPLLACGFRMISLASESSQARSVLTVAFQFPYDSSFQDSVAIMARSYVRNVVSSVQRISMAISSLGFYPTCGLQHTPASPDALTLSQWICQSYIYHVGTELLRMDSIRTESMLKTFWHHQHAILCCSLKAMPSCVFANQAGLDMLETSLVSLQDITLDKIFDEKVLSSEFAKVMQQGFAYLSDGICVSTMGRYISYERAVVWKVFAAAAEDNTTLHCLALSFVNWSFV